MVNEQQPNNPLHGITLERIVRELRDYYGWDQMAYHVNVNCFANNPSLNSSLKFLRKTDWARKKVESLDLRMLQEQNG
jgi:uncharacterized protein (DUF2132 family)